ncbi:MAG: hypothetical protein IK116_05240, partial [Firmicutes bacterium]|nr:hypothetical protein [Bacillota bacterium]
DGDMLGQPLFVDAGQQIRVVFLHGRTPGGLIALLSHNCPKIQRTFGPLRPAAQEKSPSAGRGFYVSG